MVSIRIPTSLHLTFLLTIFSLLRCMNAQLNVTVDDQYGDEVTRALPIYTPIDGWQLGTDCLECLIRPDPEQAYNGTWHYSTRRPGNGSFTIQITFVGTAVYAYFILPNYTEAAPVRTSISFSLDWNIVGSFEHDPGTTLDFVYDALGYANTNLENSAHTFVIESIISGGQQSTILFDRLVYTTGDVSEPALNSGAGSERTTDAPIISTADTFETVPQGTGTTALPTLSAPGSADTASASTSSNKPSPSDESNGLPRSGIISGSVLGAVGIILISILAFLFVRYRRRRAASGDVIPYSVPILPYKKQAPDVMERGSIISNEQGEVGSIVVGGVINGVIDISVERSRSGSGPEGGTNVLSRSRFERDRTDSLAVMPPTSEVHRTNQKTEIGPDAYPLEKDPFQRDVFDEKHERLASRSRSSPSTGYSPSPTNTGTRGTERTNASEQILLEHIATLQAEVDRLQDRHSFGADVPPPSYYVDDPPVGHVEERGRAV